MPREGSRSFCACCERAVLVMVTASNMTRRLRRAVNPDGETQLSDTLWDCAPLNHLTSTRDIPPSTALSHCNWVEGDPCIQSVKMAVLGLL